MHLHIVFVLLCVLCVSLCRCSFVCVRHSIFYVCVTCCDLDVTISLSETEREKARGNNNDLSYVPSKRKEIKSRTSGCGSFVVPYFQPATSSEVAAQLHLPAHDVFWANLRVQLHLPPLDLAWNPESGVMCRPTLRAPFSGTFLQTLPDLVTPLKEHSLSPRNCPATRSAPSERFGY